MLYSIVFWFLRFIFVVPFRFSYICELVENLVIAVMFGPYTTDALCLRSAFLTL